MCVSHFLLTSVESRHRIVNIKNKTSVRLFSIGVEDSLDEKDSKVFLDHLIYHASVNNKLSPLTLMPDNNLLYSTVDAVTLYGQVAVVDYLT